MSLFRFFLYTFSNTFTSFFSSYLFLSGYGSKSSTSTSRETEQVNNRADSCRLRKLACIGGGFKQTVAN